MEQRLEQEKEQQQPLQAPALLGSLGRIEAAGARSSRYAARLVTSRVALRCHCSLPVFKRPRNALLSHSYVDVCGGAWNFACPVAGVHMWGMAAQVW